MSTGGLVGREEDVDEPVVDTLVVDVDDGFVFVVTGLTAFGVVSEGLDLVECGGEGLGPFFGVLVILSLVDACTFGRSAKGLVCGADFSFFGAGAGAKVDFCGMGDTVLDSLEELESGFL